jgi:hypothetical protein
MTSPKGRKMMRTLLTICAVLAMTVPATALDYDCSPITGGCTPRASQPSAFDSPYPSTYVPRERCIFEGRCSGERRYSHGSRRR